jgi:hypothetical protein
MADEIPPRFRKTKNGKWAVMAPIDALEKAINEGGKIDVQRKSGDWSTFAVASLGRPFDVDGVQMAYGYGPDEEGDGDASPAPGSATGGPGPDRGPGPRRRSGAAMPDPPPPDPSEPLPDYQGGPEDEWDGF